MRQKRLKPQGIGPRVWTIENELEWLSRPKIRFKVGDVVRVVANGKPVGRNAVILAVETETAAPFEVQSEWYTSREFYRVRYLGDDWRETTLWPDTCEAVECNGA